MFGGGQGAICGGVERSDVEVVLFEVKGPLRIWFWLFDYGDSWQLKVGTPTLTFVG